MTAIPSLPVVATPPAGGQPYGDPTDLNSCRVILDAVGRDILGGIVGDYLDLLGTSAAVYEKNGDYAYGIFSSGWCRKMDARSRELCGPVDNREALACGKWHCHESCWAISRESIDTNAPADHDCQGGIHIYAVPIRVDDEVVGSINFGYGDPPTDPAKLAELAERYGLPADELRREGAAYESRSAFILDMARSRLATAARLIGEIVKRKRVEARLREVNDTLELRVRERTADLEAANARTRRDSALIRVTNDALSQFISPDRSTATFEGLLNNLLSLTGCEYGFIDEVWHPADGPPYLTALAITNIAWDDNSRQLYARFRSGELRWDNARSLYGPVFTTGEVVIANDAPNDPRRAGTPPGHPPLNAFLGLPLRYGSRMVGIIGLANAPGGFDPAMVSFLEPVTNACAILIAALKADRQRRSAEDDLSRRTEQLAEANKELDSFAYSVSHDLRAPLRAIDGYARILADEYTGCLPDEAREFLRKSRAGAQQMGRLVDDLLAFSRLGRQRLKTVAVDVNALVREVVADLQAADPGRAVEVTIADLPPCQADRSLLRQVFANLLENAFKFTRGRAPARVAVGGRTDAAPGETIYFVRDNGIGFDMQYADKLFGVFQRMHRAEEYEGTGVGLAIVQRIIHRHGGRVWAETAIDQGATFFFTLGRATNV